MFIWCYSTLTPSKSDKGRSERYIVQIGRTSFFVHFITVISSA